jgi:hypothetical protein
MARVVCRGYVGLPSGDPGIDPLGSIRQPLAMDSGVDAIAAQLGGTPASLSATR